MILIECIKLFYKNALANTYNIMSVVKRILLSRTFSSKILVNQLPACLHQFDMKPRLPIDLYQHLEELSTRKLVNAPIMDAYPCMLEQISAVVDATREAAAWARKALGMFASMYINTE